MLSFELSAMDIVLVITAVIILLLYVTKLTQPTARSEPSAKEKKTGIYIKILNIFRNKKTKTSSQTVPLKCSHHFGYLKNIPKDSSIPKECYICPRMIQCATCAKE